MSGGETEARPSIPLAPAPVPADIGIVAALPIEVAPLVDRFRSIRRYLGPKYRIIEGECAGKLVALVLAGPGRSAARRATQLLLDGHRPAWVVSAGFAGALDPSLARNDVVFATEVLEEAGAHWSIGLTEPPHEPARRIRSGRLLTVDRIVRTAAEKAELFRRLQADIVDMETSAVAEQCSARQVRLLAIRVVSDEASTDLPPEILSILGRTGAYRIGAALGALWRRPSGLKELWTLREHALEAAERLAEVVEGALTRL